MTLSRDEYANPQDSELVWEGVELLFKIEEGRTMSMVLDIYGNLPSYASFGYKAPDEIILSILYHNPEATKRHGSDYWIPLHVAAMWRSSAKVMEELIKLNPQALDDQGEPGIKWRAPRHFEARFKHLKILLERSTSEWIKSFNEENGR